MNKKNISLIAIILLVLLAGYFAFFRKRAPEALTVTPVVSNQILAGAEVLSALTRLQTLDLDDSVFKDPVFRNLKNFGREIIKVPVGRNNPFAPFDQIRAGRTVTNTSLNSSINTASTTTP